ncbi:MAG: PAAR-like domain-containing protein, partial [Myxococcota bacterium]
PLGNEAATKSFGSSILTHQTTGKTQFQASSMDVKFEGKLVCRHLDLTTSNHMSPVGDGPTINAETQTTGSGKEEDDLTKCPCCKGPLHDNQKDPDTGQPYERCTEDQWYQGGVTPHDDKVTRMNAFLSKQPGWAAQGNNQNKIDETLRKQKEAQAAMDKIRQARTQSPPCENLHDPPDQDCGVHFKKTNPNPGTSDSSDRKRLGFTDGVRRQCIRDYKNAGRTCTWGSEVCHKTPLAAGGCPNDPKNLIPKEILSPECAEIDDAQTSLQSLAAQSLIQGP